MRITVISLTMFALYGSVGQAQGVRERIANRIERFTDKHATKDPDVGREYDELRQKAEVERVQHPDAKKERYSLRKLVSITKKRNYQVRANAEKVYRARQNIKLAIGALLPSLNMSTVLSTFDIGTGGVSVGSFTDLAASFLGFLFPSNWFRWKESKLYYEAERYGYAVLVANQINTVESQYYYVHLLRSMDRKYGEYISSLDDIVSKVRLRVEGGEALFDGLARLENILTLVKQDHILIQETLKELYYNLSFAVALDYQHWPGFDIKSLNLPDLGEADELNPDDYEPDVIEKSLELKQFDFMIKGSRYAQKTRMFDFLTPGSNPAAALGFGYPSYLKIGRSETRELEIKKEEMEGNLRLALEKAIVSYNQAIAFFKESEHGYNNSKLLINFIVRKFDEGGIFEGAELIDAVESELHFLVHMLQAQHRNLISLAQVNRLTLAEPYYGNMMSVVPKVEKRKMGLRKKLEERRIKRDIKKGKLKI